MGPTSVGQTTDLVSTRTKSRKEALDVLYESDIRGCPPQVIVEQRATRGEQPIREYSLRLVEGVWSNRARIDDVIATYSAGWDLDRMPVVDRNLLRLAIYEILFESEIPPAVAIDEAVDAAKALSTDESAAFINGLLGQVLPLRQTP